MTKKTELHIQKIYLVATVSQISSGAYQASNLKGIQALPQKLKQQGCEAGQLLPCNAIVRNVWSCTYITLPHAFMVQWLTFRADTNLHHSK
jgi:hypothetical protein